MESSLPLSHCHVKKTELVINRLHTFLHGIALLALFYYRLTSLTDIIKNKNTSLLLPHVPILISELILSFIWLLSQASKWRPVARKAYPERVPGDEKLPSIDVFICTADPTKEPCLKVMNTVISAMALDYPPDKLHVYLSDDGGSVATLQAIKQAWKFSRLWVPFCRKYKVKMACPEAYFLTDESGPDGKFHSTEFRAEKKEIKKSYMEFKDSVTKIIADTSIYMSRDHPPIIEVIDDANGDGMDSDKRKIPLLVYVAREKRPSHPHHFKAGALNVLLRVSAMISNSPYILVLDCDMYCNDPSSARQAMCFHLDPELSPKLGFVQFPQKFYNINETDINDGKQRAVWVGFRYFSVVEDYFTGFILHCKGWISVYFDPSTPGFLGATPISLGEILVQQTRWSVGFYQVALSRFSPLIYGLLRTSTSQSMCYAEFPYSQIYFLSLYVLAVIPQLCLIIGISLYPKVSSPFFVVFSFVFLSSQLKHVQEVFSAGHSIRTWSNEQRMWMMKSLTSYLFAALEVVMEKLGLAKARFLPTNKVVDDEQAKLYQMGVYDFRAPALFMVPLCSLYILNVASFIIGFGRIMQTQKWGEMFIQAFIPFFATILHFPLLEGMVLRKDKGRVSPSVSLLSAVISTIFVSFAALVNYY
ncbi:Cellulose synthase-like protein G1 [Sesamum alatum]|uniref:Cellulose synthase-like protein G1 n=1 Tax=Sesamum alatum TaxID=300844 RepID=A0AAE2CKJ1_9LAMI|nr:Cellulose synthase-like protein G1 [Sesamum alatum]